MDDIAAIAIALLGQPNAALSHGHELRFHARGSLAINVRKGQFYDFEAGVGGGALQLVVHLGAARTREDAREWLKEKAIAPRSVPAVEKVSRANPSHAIERAMALLGDSQPIGGTHAELYLRRRSIDP